MKKKTINKNNYHNRRNHLCNNDKIIFDSFLLIDNDELFLIVNFISTIDSKLKHVCFNDVIIYEQQKIVDAIIALIDEYQNLFVNKETAMNISKKK